MWVRRLGVQFPLESRPGSRHFLSQKRRHLHKQIRSWVENKWSCRYTVENSNVNLKVRVANKNIYIARISVPKHETESAWSQWVNWLKHSLGSEGWGFEPPRVKDFLSTKFDTFTNTSVNESKVDDVVCTQLTFQMLALQRNVNTYICVCVFVYLYFIWFINIEMA